MIDPEEEEHAVGGRRGDQLALGERRHEEAAGDERRRQEPEPEVAGDERARRDRRDAREQQRMDRGRRNHRAHDREAGEELPGDDLGVAHRVGPQELERAELPLLGEEPHGEQRHEDEQEALESRNWYCQSPRGRFMPPMSTKKPRFV